MDPAWADRFAGLPVRQSWPDEATIQAHQAIEGPFTARGQFRDGASPYPLMPGAIASRADFEHMLTGYDAAIALGTRNPEPATQNFNLQPATCNS